MTANSQVAGWAGEFEQLAEKWPTAVAAWEKACRQEVVEEARSWTESFDAIEEEYFKLREEGRWVGGPEDFLRVLGRSRSELDHSALIGWLLDPCMHHGLGSRFLKAMLRRCFPGEPPSRLGSAHAEREVHRGDCRADIVVWGNELTLVIENKVDALEGEGQCDAYFKAFGRETGARFLFLSPSGRPPSTATGAAAESFETLSYHQVREDLATVLAETEGALPGKARGVATGYLAALRKEFG